MPLMKSGLWNDEGVSRRTVAANGLQIPILEAGDGPLVLCLHGFPDHARSWTPILRRLAWEGYWAVAPAMRGYWPGGAAPDGQYGGSALGMDVLALIAALGRETADLVGHDIGARAAYAAAGLEPDRIRKLVGMAVPYGQQLLTAFAADGDQQRRSWYMFFFQTRLAEVSVPLNDFAFIDRLWREWSPSYALPNAERALLKESLGQPGVLSQTFGFYRQLFGAPPEDAALQARANGPVNVPSLYLHGAEDGCMAAYLSEGMEALFPRGLEKEIIPGVGHFLHLEQPDTIATRIVKFLGP
ncbi:MAG: alpha/beta hydrolase [Pseudomonadota bacterium]|uniref:alpha/beta fold hydrolase n=1 Tax=Phenylobacterium sp. TaxID=1871053 RepID=UPI0025E37221|nr:alpha/beta hydrolase [Phenylobacterium sp.]MBT9470188.1 alpha/beta hydrolase [Phenylobacterium sp.]